MWYVALGWHAIELPTSSAIILEFYIWFPFPHITAVCEILSKSDHLRQKKMTSCRFSRWCILAILDCRDPIMGSLTSPTSYRSSIDTIALNCLVFEKIAFFAFWRQDQPHRKGGGYRGNCPGARGLKGARRVPSKNLSWECLLFSSFRGDTPKNLFTSGAQRRWGHNLLLFLVSLKSSPWQWQGFQQDDRHNDSIF